MIVAGKIAKTDHIRFRRVVFHVLPYRESGMLRLNVGSEAFIDFPLASPVVVVQISNNAAKYKVLTRHAYNKKSFLAIHRSGGLIGSAII